MNPPPPGSLAAVLDALGHGLPMLIIQVVACAGLLAIGVTIYVRLTPFHERELVAGGNAAAGTVLAGSILALAIPLAAMLATSGTLLDVLVWGVVALILQLLTLGVVGAGHAQSSRHDRRRQCRRGDYPSRRADRRRVAQCGGDGAELNLAERRSRHVGIHEELGRREIR